jgi:hypothetical protein
VEICRDSRNTANITIHLQWKCSSEFIGQTGYICEGRFCADEEVSINSAVDGIYSCERIRVLVRTGFPSWQIPFVY